MEYTNHLPIYLQIVDALFEKVLDGTWKAGDRIPSVREMAVTMEVNPNTLMRSYSYMEDMKIISMSRGVGYFLCQHAQEEIKAIKKAEFLERECPHLFKMMDILDIKFDELQKLYETRV